MPSCGCIWSAPTLNWPKSVGIVLSDRNPLTRFWPMNRAGRKRRSPLRVEGPLALYFEPYSEYLANRGYSQISYWKKTFLINECSRWLEQETIAAGVPQPTIGARTMPILDVSKSHHLHGFALLPCAPVGIVLHSEYDLVLAPYQG